MKTSQVKNKLDPKFCSTTTNYSEILGLILTLELLRVSNFNCNHFDNVHILEAKYVNIDEPWSVCLKF